MHEDTTPVGWTDLHMHPVPADLRLQGELLRQTMQALAIDEILVVTVHAGGDHWDATDDPDLINEQEQCSIDDLLRLADDPDAGHVTGLVDPRQSVLADLVADLAGRPGWQPCVLTIGLGATSIPDLQLQETAARFASSIAIGGHGWPPDPVRAARALTRHPAIVACCDSLAELWGVRCTSHLSLSDWANSSDDDRDGPPSTNAGVES